MTDSSPTRRPSPRSRRKKQQRRRLGLFSLALFLLLILALLLGSWYYRCHRGENEDPAKTEEETDPTLLERWRYPLEYQTLVAEAAQTYALDEALIYAVILTESSFRPEAVSPAGAIGLMQLMPETYSWLCEKRGMTEESDRLTDPALNIDFGAYYLRLLLDYYDGSLSNALLAYNAGIGRVNSWLAEEQLPRDGVLASVPLEETADYLVKVTHAMDEYKRIYKGDYTND